MLDLAKKYENYLLLFMILIVFGSGIYLGKYLYGLPDYIEIPQPQIEIEKKTIEIPVFTTSAKLIEVPEIKVRAELYGKTLIDTVYQDTLKILVASNDTTITFKDTLTTPDTVLTAEGEIRISTDYYFPPYNRFKHSIKPTLPIYKITEYKPFRVPDSFLDRLRVGAGFMYGSPTDHWKPTTFIGLGLFYGYSIRDLLPF